MNNLFVLHTQYNIILGSSIVLKSDKNTRNDLIVYAEFKLSDAYQRHIESVFDNVFYIRKEFKPLPVGLVKTEVNLYKEFKSFRKTVFARTKYDNVFISQDRPLDCLIVGQCKKRNPDCCCYDIEEDCYYSLRKEMNDENFRIKQGRNRIHKLRKLVYGGKYIHEPGHYFYGQSSFFTGYYVLYPECVRKEILEQSKIIYKIEKEYLIKSVNAIYGEQPTLIPTAEKYYLFFFDLLERYSNPDGIRAIVGAIAIKANAENACLLLKYHPRETEKFEIDGAFEVPSIVPAEKLLCDLTGKNVTVLGNATTSIIVGNYLSFKTICIAKINGFENEAMLNKYKDMGIMVPASKEEI